VADLGIFRTHSNRKKLAGDLIGDGEQNKTPKNTLPDSSAPDIFVWPVQNFSDLTIRLNFSLFSLLNNVNAVLDKLADYIRE
jgi:hypothetical protein